MFDDSLDLVFDDAILYEADDFSLHRQTNDHRAHRSALAKFRCGEAPIKIETGRYENLSIHENKCIACDAVEYECHVIRKCRIYKDMPTSLFAKARNVLQNFYTISNFDKMCISLLNCDIVNPLWYFEP